MSRYTKFVKKDNTVYEVAYGFDRMTKLGGYFFQVFEHNKESRAGDSENEPRVILNEGMIRGISRTRMLQLMDEWSILDEDSRMNIALDLPI